MARTKQTARVGKQGGKTAPTAPTPATPAPGGGAPQNAGGHPSMGGKCPRRQPLKKLPDPKVRLRHM